MNTRDQRPLLALSMGDPAGIGPQILAAAWAESSWRNLARPLVVGSPGVMRRACELVGARVNVRTIESPSQYVDDPQVMSCVAVEDAAALAAPAGTTSRKGGQASLAAVQRAVQLALQGDVAGVVTAPIDKAAWAAAGGHWPGHTELLAELCGCRRSAMLLYLPPRPARPGLGVVHATLHVALRDVPQLLNTELILWQIGLLHEAVRRLLGQQPAPQLGVCALNPHAGEQGLFGDEEIRIIAPAVEQAQARGIPVEGPLAADTLMMRAASGQLAGVVAMYHDQGHIALKLLGVDRPVNITLGLPLVRTSVAHGTAYDLAWKKQQTHAVSHQGLLRAIETASQLAGG